MKHTVERINWDLAEPDQFEYHRAVYGHLLPLPPHECEVVSRYGRAGWATVERAADAIIATKNIVIYDRPKDFQTADQIVVAFLNAVAFAQHSAHHDFGSATWHAFLTLALALAKRDTMYWRVSDPTREAFCSYCRRKQPLSRFTKYEAACDLHNLKRGSNNNRRTG